MYFQKIYTSQTEFFDLQWITVFNSISAKLIWISRVMLSLLNVQVIQYITVNINSKGLFDVIKFLQITHNYEISLIKVLNFQVGIIQLSHFVRLNLFRSAVLILFALAMAMFFILNFFSQDKSWKKFIYLFTSKCKYNDRLVCELK